MNYIDIGVLAVFAFFLLLGWYEGFWQSVLGVVSFFLSWMTAALFSGLLAGRLKSVDWIFQTLITYIEGAERVGTVEQANMAVSALTAEQVDKIVETSALPYPLPQVVEKNLYGEVFAGEGATTVGEYFNLTMANFCINLISFAIIFLIVRLALLLILKGIDYTRPLPMLAHFDSLMGSGFSIVRAFFALFFLFMAVPLLLIALPTSGSVNTTFVSDYVSGSFFGSFFYNFNFLLSLLGGT